MNRPWQAIVYAGMLAWGFCLLPSCAMEGTGKSEGSGAAPAETPKAESDKGDPKASTEVKEIKKSDEEWKKELSAEAYHVLREKGTERAFTGKYWDSKKEGTYLCAGCGLELFSSKTKYKSGTGWPSFYQPIRKEHVGEVKDTSHGMTRVEVVCARCKGHLGHVFGDGPKPTGLRYCINSLSLDLKEKGAAAKDGKDESDMKEKDAKKD